MILPSNCERVLQRALTGLLGVFVVASCGIPPDQDPSTGGGLVDSTPSFRAASPGSGANLQDPPKLQADAYCLVDATSGKILASRRGWESRPVASTQKLLTALVVAEAGDLYKQVTISAADVDIHGSVLGLRPGENVSRMDLLKAMLIVSANDASLALARDVAGSVKAFASMMNRRAEMAGATRSNFANPHGLTQGGQRSNAKDMAIIAMAAYANPLIRSIVGTVEDSAAGRPLRNTNELLGRLPGCTGMKTGITPGAGICLISSLEAQGRTLILVQLESTRSAIYNDAAKAMWWGLEAR